MAINDGIYTMLRHSGKMQIELAEYFGMSKQTFNNKMRYDRWTGKDLIKIADFFGGKLAFIMSNGQQIIIEADGNEDSPDA